MKKCIKCLKEKPIEEFSFKDKKKNIRQTKCRECFKIYRREYYSKNKEKALNYSRESTKEIRDRNRSFVYNYLLENPCVDCEEKNPVILEFDHFRDKEFNIAHMINHGYSLDKIKDEIKKCKVRCCNCHRMKTAKDFNYWSYRKYAGIV